MEFLIKLIKDNICQDFINQIEDQSKLMVIRGMDTFVIMTILQYIQYMKIVAYQIIFSAIHAIKSYWKSDTVDCFSMYINVILCLLDHFILCISVRELVAL